MGHGYAMGMHAGFGFGGFIISLLWWVIIIALIGAVVRWSFWHRRRGPWMGGMGGPGRFGMNAVEILKERYAKGEINKEEFERIKKDIEA